MESLVKRRVGMGSRALVQFADGAQEELTVRGRDVDLAAGIISSFSPLGRALLAAAEGEVLTYHVHKMPHTITVLRVFEPAS